MGAAGLVEPVEGLHVLSEAERLCHVAGRGDLDTRIITEYHLAQDCRQLHETGKRSAARARFKELRKTQ